MELHPQHRLPVAFTELALAIRPWPPPRFQAQGVLPVDPTPYGVSGLPIGQILGELRDRDQR
jgi:hypothetical protein